MKSSKQKVPSKTTYRRIEPRLRLEPLESREVPAVVGALDPSFGTGGQVSVPGAQYSAVVLQPDGRIVTVGSNSDSDFLVARFNPDGTPDLTFGGSGEVTMRFDNVITSADAVALQPDGKIVVAGSTGDADTLDYAVARFNPDGTPDPTFGTGGQLEQDFNGFVDRAKGVAVAANGNIYVVGIAGGDNSTQGFGILALTPTGTPLAGFGTHGLEFDSVSGGDDEANAIAIQPDGKLVVAGISLPPAEHDVIALVRLDPATGRRDPGFGTAGQFTTSVGGTSNSAATAVAVQPDGKIVAADVADTLDAQSEAIVDVKGGAIRLTPAGALDTTFGTGGESTIDLGTDVTNTNMDAIALQPDGKIVLAGGNRTDVVALRLTTTGQLDPAFHSSGPATFDFTGESSAFGMALQPDGRIVAAGTTNSQSNGLVVRLIGTVEKGTQLAVSGSPAGTAAVFTPGPTGQYGTAPATVPAVGGPGTARTAVGDVNGDGIPDTVVVTGPGTPIRVDVVSGANGSLLVPPFDPFGGDFTGGGFVAAGDIDGDGRAEFVVTPDQGGGPRVAIFKLNPGGTTSTTTLANFFGIDDPNFRGGARAALGDVNGDGVPDLAVAAGFLGGPRVALFDGKTLLTTPARLVSDFFAFPGTDATTLRNGVFVSIGDVNGDGSGDLIFGGGPGGAPRVFILSGALVAAGNVAGAQASPVANFFVAGNAADRGGARVAATDADGDNKADLAVGSGAGDPANVRVYRGRDFDGGGGEPLSFQDLEVFGGAALPGSVYVG